ncbi:DNA mismatch repair endonuclease MutL [Mariniplasma anaerobium]|uniref:DNA mismatch repair protein MutL n=1 Tax=Mariniplasma anaerobium TaxID=2735436 RepID=A0A7U9TIY3_9MOLU|nr:DNA mismatch repair endonuclease MutL [Mariniplasma anaerobium]BCR35665.1 DNA mismatch repair protein MutL [Mariniplasma anaerobium]
MSVIKQMDNRLANMIAAGEVVDRPSSIVKELIENAIDAQAKEIIVEIYEVGMKKIIVSDNGSGMDFSDAHLAFERHATSKIASEKDLNHIYTLGFRGEALAAIAAVSKVSLKTKMEDSKAIEVIYHGGHFIKDNQTSLNTGTIITVEDLFYNTPARFKYIKSEQAERYAIIDIFDRLALANPKVRFKLFMDEKLVKQTYGKDDFFQLIDQIYGSKITNDMIKFDQKFQNIEIKGYLVSPKITRSRKKDISIFVNHRYIKNYKLIQAVVDGYHSFLMTNKYPIALIHLSMDPQLLDVNVHPQKYEVKFVNELILAFQIEHFIREALEKKTHTISDRYQEIKKVPQETYEVFHLDFEDVKEEDEHKDYDNKEAKIPSFDYIGIFAGTYLLFQNHEGLFLVDQHAAQERIRYEHYFERLGNPNSQIRQLLIPHDLNVTSSDLEVINQYIDQFKRYQFIIKDNQIIGLPTWLREQEIDKAIEEIISQLSEKETIDLKILRDHLAKDISCKGSIKANHHINKQEVDILMSDLRLCKNPYYCPHGRPTIIKLTHYDVERMFKRVI